MALVLIMTLVLVVSLMGVVPLVRVLLLMASVLLALLGFAPLMGLVLLMVLMPRVRRRVTSGWRVAMGGVSVMSAVRLALSFASGDPGVAVTAGVVIRCPLFGCPV